MSNQKKEQAVSLFQQQTLKVKYHEKMINILQSLAFAKSNKLLLFIKKIIDQYSSSFIYALSPLINRQLPSKI